MRAQLTHMFIEHGLEEKEIGPHKHSVERCDHDHSFHLLTQLWVVKQFWKTIPRPCWLLEIG